MTPAFGRGHDFDAIRMDYPLLAEVQNHVKMRRAGKEWVGLCPFHDERTPSFFVNPDKERFHCQGCSAKGDVIDFVSKISAVSPTEAINIITGGKVVMMNEVVRSERDRAREDREMEEEQRKQAASREAQRRWERAKPTEDHPYLMRKGASELAMLCRCEGDALLVPVHDAEGEIQTVQAIPSGDGKKLFHAGAPSRLGRLYIGISFGGATIVCEGFATGASLYLARADRVCVTFSAGNMDAVARALVADGVPIVLAPDKDQVVHFEEVGRELGVPVIAPAVRDAKGDFNDQHRADGLESVAATLAGGLKEYAAKIGRDKRDAERENEPLDLWTKTPIPAFSPAFFPDVIGRFASVRADMIGCDASGLAVAAIAACGAVISDTIKLRMKRHDDGWTENARLWVMLVGDPSRKKTPILSAVSRKLAHMDADMVREHDIAFRDWSEDKQGAAPLAKRLRISNITVESASEICAANPDGVLSLQDELSGWFGGIEKYSGGKGGSADRAFWLQAYNGGHYAVDRVGRKAAFVDNLSISMIGGVQPGPIRKLMEGSSDDGLIQRFLPIMLGEPSLGKDIEMPDVAAEYDALIGRLHAMKPPETFLGTKTLVFDDEAQALRNALEAKHLAMMTGFEGVNRKVASHVGKYDGMFGRLCVIFHCIRAATEAPGEPLGAVVGIDTAKRAEAFLHRFLRRHALAFYTNVGGLSDDHDILTDLAGYIIAHKAERVSMRTLGRGTQRMKKLTNYEGHAIFEQLVAHGWLDEDSKRSDAKSWAVNPMVHVLYADRAREECERREAARVTIRDMLSGD